MQTDGRAGRQRFAAAAAVHLFHRQSGFILRKAVT